ncbi:hypothetical protein GCM10007853_04300 [Algimonas ampicilliniresistens]|uniref:DUF5681 domain-containing protein n=1 Tax=Algimonas ampicilliniresistens TaxID=1298735 RepID=A0ABQ5V4V2_9PROT|nr:DUF5681 domain-containing protein [Algimonas ampicilliniresistens]GLQ22556.1 hypothetical protein GCM10007853_04300 [Algimonas ampicilliniresistens]
MPDKPDPDYKVGYGKPPSHTRFKPGRSGNPKGRPKNARGLKTDLRAELVSKMKIRMNGEDVSGTKQQLMLRTLTTRAASGDVSATRILIDLVMQVFGPEDHTTGPKRLSQIDQQILDQLLSRQSPAASEPPVPDNSPVANLDAREPGSNPTQSNSKDDTNHD